jgi:uncharacterized Zn-finger protein
MELSFGEGERLAQAVGGTAVEFVELRYVLEQNHKVYCDMAGSPARTPDLSFPHAYLKIEHNCSIIGR